MKSTRQKKYAEEIRKHAGNFIAAEANRKSLITPTEVDVSPDLKQVTVYFSVFPIESEEMAVHFLKRKRNDFRTYIKQNGYTKVLPFVDFELDMGEKNRQIIDEISQRTSTEKVKNTENDI
jgi:ribosome-binding factor A